MSKKHKETTKIIHAGYDPKDYHGVVNPPLTRVSTIIQPSLEKFENWADNKFDYGRNNTPLMESFTQAITELEQGYNALAASCGLSAITASLLGFLKTGDHLLMVDGAYGCTRRFCNYTLKRMGIKTTYYDPHIGADITELIQENTRVIFMESPGSSTFDVQDVPAIIEAAKAHSGITTMVDNSWASGVLFKPLTLGADISIISCTKYINGHADGMLGVATARDEEVFDKLKKAFRSIGSCAGSEEVNLGIRGLKTLHVRMREAGDRALQIAQWLEKQDAVRKVYYPALPSHQGHNIWKRDFTGANGIVSILLQPSSKEAFRAFVEGLQYFPIGDSWGGYESLTQPQHMIVKARTAVPWNDEGFLVRFQIGLEDPQDLMDDLDQALKIFGEYL